MKTPQEIRGAAAVVGAGPAGLMAAEVIASAGYAVTVYERMASPARKFLMAGRGGLNLTHSEPLETFLTRYSGDADAVRRAVRAFPPNDLVAWAEGLGQQTFKGSSGRIFPKAMKASPLLRAWLRRLDALGVAIELQHTWSGFGDGNTMHITTADGQRHAIRPDACVLALGGASWPRLGSDGAWTKDFETAGIDVAALQASNSGAVIDWSQHYRARFAGHPLKRIAVTVDGITRRGEAVVTRTGIEGSVIYALGPKLRDAVHRNGSATLTIDLKPDATIEELATRLARPKGAQSWSNFLRKAAALDSAAIGLLRETGPLPAEPEALARLIKNVPLTTSAPAGLERAISTAGGVRFSELTDDLMLTHRPGAFIAGEMLDWDAPTGGYLLQASFATGRLAGEGVTRWLGAAKIVNCGPLEANRY